MSRRLLCLAVLLVPTALGTSGDIEVRVLGGYAYGLEDTPPHAWLAGAAVTVPLGSRMRLGLEVLHAHMFGFEYYERRAPLINPVVEYQFSPGGRVSPYPTGCLDFTPYRSLFPPGPDALLDWEYGGPSISAARACGCS